MKRSITPLILLMLAILPLSACAFNPLSGQARAVQRLKAMDAEKYFQGSAQIALVDAAGRGDILRMRQLIAAGADVNQVGRDGVTPLFWAAGIKHNLEGFKFLLEHGADPNIATRLSEEPRATPIIEIVYYLKDPAYMKALLEHGANPDTIVDDGDGTLLSMPLTDHRLAQIKLLVKYGADVNHRAQYDTTPLLDAVFGDEYKTALFLLRAGADPTIENSVNGNTVVNTVKYFRERKKRYQDKLPGYAVFIEALKQRGYLDEDF